MEFLESFDYIMDKSYLTIFKTIHSSDQMGIYNVMYKVLILIFGSIVIFSYNEVVKGYIMIKRVKLNHNNTPHQVFINRREKYILEKMI